MTHSLPTCAPVQTAEPTDSEPSPCIPFGGVAPNSPFVHFSIHLFLPLSLSFLPVPIHLFDCLKGLRISLSPFSVPGWDCGVYSPLLPFSPGFVNKILKNQEVNS